MKSIFHRRECRVFDHSSEFKKHIKRKLEKFVQDKVSFFILTSKLINVNFSFFEKPLIIESLDKHLAKMEKINVVESLESLKSNLEKLNKNLNDFSFEGDQKLKNIVRSLFSDGLF